MTDDPAPRQLDDGVEALVQTHLGSTGRVSLWFGPPDGLARYARDARAPHYAASTMKLPLVIAAHRLHERGELDLDAAVEVRNAFASRWDGGPFILRQDDDQDDETWAGLGGRVALRELARRCLVRSGNLATNLLLEQVGTAEVTAVLADAGCTSATTVNRGIGDSAAREQGLDNQVTARDLAVVLGGLATRRLASAGGCAEVERVLAAQEHRDQVPAGLPPGTYVANKTGSVDGVSHDVALVRPAGEPAYVLVVCISAPADEAALTALVAALSALVWQHR